MDFTVTKTSEAQYSETINNDHELYAQQWLRDNDLDIDFEVVVAKDNELMLDFDIPTAPSQFYTVLDILAQVLAQPSAKPVLPPYAVSKSKSGNLHVIVTLPYDMSIEERVAWQAALGSDPKREALHMLSISRNEKNPILFYERKKTQCSS